MTRLVQIKKGIVRRVALVEEPHLRVLDGCNSVFELAQSAIKSGTKLSDMVRRRLTGERLVYDPLYNGSQSGNCCRPSITLTSLHAA